MSVSTVAGALERVGVVAVAVLAGTVLLAARSRAPRPHERLRALIMLGALTLTPILLVVDIWDTTQLRSLRHRPALAVGALIGALIVVAAGKLLVRRRPELIAPLAFAALPFRIPISSGGATSHLLVPLYLVVAAGVLAHALPGLRAGRGTASGPASPSAVGRPSATDPSSWRWRRPWAAGLELTIAAFLVLYGLQASYSSDFPKALEQMVFFYVPFALLFCLLADVEWTPRLLSACLAVAVGLAIVFAGIGFVEYYRRELLLNPKVIAANQLDSYFRVNSLFFDPNIYGRFLAMVMLSLAGCLLWLRRTRDVMLVLGALAVLWGGLVLSFSQSSIAAVLLGLAVIAALRWNARDTIAVSLGAAAVALAFALLAPSALHLHLGSSSSADNSTSGRYTLVRGGVDLFGRRPLQGFGPAAFPLEYRLHENGSGDRAVSASHTTPITVAAEQGVVGLLAYLALVLAALRRLYAGARGDLPRTIVAAAFAALLLHTMLYAAFLEDPTTWVLLALGTALAAHAPRDRLPTPAGADSRLQRPALAGGT